MKVLVAYASKHGATKGIAERIAQTLGADGLEVTLESADRVRSLDGFDAFVIGSAAYMYHWLNEATRLVRENINLLRARPTWLFSSGPIGTDLVDAKGRDVYESSRPAEFAEFATALEPREEKVFFGAYDPDQPPIGLGERIGTFFIRAKIVKENLPAGDFRDWPKIEGWAHQIAQDLGRATSQPA
jgi:menaquinone-dependent protoporphyrinogen oxidase